jgi:hypothetical protein
MSVKIHLNNNKIKIDFIQQNIVGLKTSQAISSQMPKQDNFS